MAPSEAPDIDPRLERASSLPSRWYVDPEVLALEIERVFARTWQAAGAAAGLGRPGDYRVVEVAREPILLVRDQEGRLRAMSNVCRHRAGPVAEGSGNRRGFRCGYHGWSYALDGRLLNAPEFDGAEAFDRSQVRLPEARAEAWGPMVFVNLDREAPPLGEWLSGVAARTRRTPWSDLVRAERRDYVVECNWKVYVDNYLEGYHIPVVHPGLFKEIDYDAYATEVFDHASVQLAPMKQGGEELGRRYAAAFGGREEALYFWVYPNLMLNVYPDNFSYNLILPISHDRTLTIFEWFFADPDAPATREAVARTIRFSDEIQQEDVRICEAVQRGLRSRTYDRGRYSPRRESGVHHFHRLLAASLRGAAAAT